MPLSLDTYRERAELFCEESSREHYLHFAGHKTELELEAIYDRYADLFDRHAVERIREAALRSDEAAGDRDDERRRNRYLLHFAFDGLVGRETRREEAELARREASLQVEGPDGPVPYRQVPVMQANEADPERRAALERARDAVLAERLNPLHVEGLERSHALAGELGWAGYAGAYGELRGVDLGRLAEEVSRFLAATEDSYATFCDPELRRHAGRGLAELRRSDLARFFRAPELDGLFPDPLLLESFTRTIAGLGIDLAAQSNVELDVDPRPTKSPRAFCATPRVPDEVYLVVPPVGGRDDYAALFHEGGHTEHYACTDPRLAFEFRYLGDNAVTESFAFLLQHLTEDEGWMRERLGAGDGVAAVVHARAAKLIMLRRYAAKLGYELELHSATPDLGQMPARYAEHLGRALRIEWPRASWVADVDGGLYVVCYLRAWALETHWRASLRERFGERWFERREAGEWLISLWRHGQRLGAEELLAETLGEELSFDRLVADLGGQAVQH